MALFAFIKSIVTSPVDAVKELWASFKSIISEGDTLSSKRWLAVELGACAAFTTVWVDLKYSEYIVTIHNSNLLFICLALGLASVTQIVSLLRGGTFSKDEAPAAAPPAPTEEQKPQ